MRTLAGERDSGAIGQQNTIRRAILRLTLGGSDDHPRLYPAWQRARLLPGPSSCPVAGSLGADVDDPQITARVLRRAIGGFT